MKKPFEKTYQDKKSDKGGKESSPKDKANDKKKK